MIALDTNVLVRLLVDDPEADQSRRAAALLLDCRSRGEPVVITTIAVVEAVWVWCRVLRIPRAAVAEFVRATCATEPLVVLDRDEVLTAVDRWEHGRGDLAEYLIAALGERAGAHRVATFDEAVHDEPGFFAPSRAV